MLQPPFKAKGLVDYLFDFSKGVNNGIDYVLLPKDQLHSSKNTTVRGAFVGPRPVFRKITLAQSGDYYQGGSMTDMVNGRFQGACFYNPDSGLDSLMASISGHIYKFEINGNTATVSDVSNLADLNDPNQTRAWLWQAEKWVIITDGTAQAPQFYDNTSIVRSNYGTPINHTANNTTPFVIPAIGAEVAAAVNFSDVTDLAIGDVVVYQYIGSFTVQDINNPNPGDVVLLNVSAAPEGKNVPVSATNPISWVTLGNQLPPGRMGAYGLGRVWMSLTDGKQFVAGDLVGSSSGTIANNFRDAVLQITENLYLAGGGNFAVPGAYGDIRAMRFSETLDKSLGQGPLQVFTPKTVFSCDAPLDRTTWQSVTNPILTESAKGGGGLSQWSTINDNSDLISRAYDGIRSLILTRREFNSWGNVPISREVEPQLNRDSESLLGFTSAAAFDNRTMMTTEGEVVEGRGVIWKRLVVINNDPISSLQGKSQSVYDALYWHGINVFQLVQGTFAEKDRLFAFTYNELTEEIELWEILKSNSDEIYDNVVTPIVWTIESSGIDFGQKNPQIRERLRLGQAEITVHDLRGRVSFEAYYKPDFWPCWVPWGVWEECSNNDVVTETNPSYRVLMGLPEPDPRWCDTTNNRPLREGYTFQFKLVVTGHCKITSIKFTSDVVPQPRMAAPSCKSICPT